MSEATHSMQTTVLSLNSSHPGYYSEFTGILQDILKFQEKHKTSVGYCTDKQLQVEQIFNIITQYIPFEDVI